MQLNKYIAHAGICSRRKATELIKAGNVTVNNKLITEPGYKVQLGDVVSIEGKIIKPEKKVYILLNKPKDYITTVADERGRKTIMALIGPAIKHRLYPVGRLDRNTTGLLLVTNDGELAQRLMHPRYEVKKTYHVVVDKNIQSDDIRRIRQGVTLEDGNVAVDRISYIAGKRKSQVILELHSGKYRVVRRIFEYLGYTIIKLDRVAYAGLTKRGLPVAKWRFLTDKEIAMLTAR